MVNTLVLLLEKYPNMSWNWKWISYNPNITMQIICDNPDKPWNWEWISCNKFHKDDQLIKIKVKVIERAYVTYRWRNLVHWASVKYHLKQEIEYLPMIGVKYFDAMSHFNNGV